MQSYDTSRVKLEQLIASIRAWTGFVADVARVEISEEGTGYRIALQPRAAGACPLEFVLDGHEPKCDLMLGGTMYKNVPLPSLDVVLPLLEAVVDGRVVTQRTLSAATGLLKGVSTSIRLADGRVIEPKQPSVTAGNLGDDAGLESREVHYLPYRRPGR